MIGKLAGPAGLDISYRIGDTLYIRWLGAPGPREGQRYATYSPAIALQNIDDPTDFQVRAYAKDDFRLPEGQRLAGYFYEATSTLRITKVRQGSAEAVVEGLYGQVSLGDQLMPVLPMKNDIKPIVGGVQLAAAVVSGSPADRLSTTRRSFIYLNRGARDGIREGRMLQAIETVKMEGVSESPEVLAGEAIVVHVTDHFSTAMITQQFDVIRIGSLLKTKTSAQITPSQPFVGFSNPKMKAAVTTDSSEEIPTVDEIEQRQDLSLPDPATAVPEEAPPLSELDAMEKSMNIKALDAKEKDRLNKLSRQQKLDLPDSDDDDTVADAPLENSFKKKAGPKKSKKKAATRGSSEEELNLLMMEN